MIKTSCLVLFRLAQNCIIYVKLEGDDAEINIASRPGSIDRNLGSIDRNLGSIKPKFFLQNSNFVLAHYNV